MGSFFILDWGFGIADWLPYPDSQLRFASQPHFWDGLRSADALSKSATRLLRRQ